MTRPQIRPCQGLTVWLTGLSGAGKSTTARWLACELRARHHSTLELDGDVLRRNVNGDLGFSIEDRAEAVRRAGGIALLGAIQGHISVVSLVSPSRSARNLVRQRHDDEGIEFVEVHMATPLATCEQRDAKGLYAKARAGGAIEMTGVQQHYEAPRHPDITLSTVDTDPADVSAPLLELVIERLAAHR